MSIKSEKWLVMLSILPLLKSCHQSLTDQWPLLLLPLESSSSRTSLMMEITERYCKLLIWLYRTWQVHWLWSHAESLSVCLWLLTLRKFCFSSASRLVYSWKTPLFPNSVHCYSLRNKSSRSLRSLAKRTLSLVASWSRRQSLTRLWRRSDLTKPLQRLLRKEKGPWRWILRTLEMNQWSHSSLSCPTDCSLTRMVWLIVSSRFMLTSRNWTIVAPSPILSKKSHRSLLLMNHSMSLISSQFLVRLRMIRLLVM